jgi:rhodanese-related sulfurtransferase
MRLISRGQLKTKLDEWQDLKLVFVLGDWHYRAMHIPGSLSLPCSPNLWASEEILSELDRDDEIVVYCSNETCYASIMAYYVLMQRGFRNVRRYAGGLLDWEDAGYPLDGEMVSTGSKSGSE